MAQVVIVDFEGENTSPDFTYFGSTLDQTMANKVANPDASGINTSATVSDFTKPPSSETWAGAFANGDMHADIDMTINTEICVKVWFNQPGNVAIKLENSSNGFENWITQQEVTETQTWTNICFSALDNSIEDPGQAAAGGIFSGLVLFFDFGEVLTEERSYFFDDIIVSGDALEPSDITFTVNMSEYTEAFTGVYVSGTFNEWAGDANPMTDNGDGTWSATVEDVTPGAHEYKFQLDQWAAQEMFNGTETCTIKDESGQFVNRRLSVSTDATLDPVCFNSCFNCGEGVNITINLGNGGITVSDDGLFIAGGGNFGAPGDFPLTDEDEDGVYSITIERAAGFESFYTFTNGACGDFSCKENIEGQDCANPDNFNDRKMGPVTEDLVINTCFGQCTESTDCDTNQGTITFQVDMSGYTEAFTQVYISGTLNNWAGDANPLTDQGNGIWSTEIPLLLNTFQYKFTLDNWAVQEEFTAGDPCTATDGAFVNRVIEVTGDALVCFEWNTCTMCTGVGITEVDNSIFSIQPTLVDNETLLTFGEQFTQEKELRIFNAVGQNIKAITIAANANQYLLDASQLANGLYFINVQTDAKQLTQRIIINR